MQVTKVPAIIPTSPAKNRFRLHYCLLKAGRDVGVGDVGAGFHDFSSWLEIGTWVHSQLAEGRVISILAVRSI